MRSEENFKNPTRVNILRLKREDVASMKQEYNTMGNNGSNNKNSYILKRMVKFLKISRRFGK